MKHLIFSLLLVISAFSGHSQTAEEIIAKHIAAMGGKAKLALLNTVKKTGSMALPDASKIPYTVTCINLKGIRKEMDVQGNIIYGIQTPGMAWTYIPGQMSEPKSEKKVDFTAEYFDMQKSYFERYADAKVKYAGIADAEGHPAYRMEIWKNEKIKETVFLDTASYRIIKKSYEDDEKGMTDIIYGNYRQNADGFWFAYSESIDDIQLITYNRIETNIPVDEKILIPQIQPGNAALQIQPQSRVDLPEKMVVKDSAGNIIPLSTWMEQLKSGEYSIRPIYDTGNSAKEIAYLLYHESAEQAKKNKMMQSRPPGAEPKKGDLFSGINATDINGKQVNTADLKGKVLVINYWFTSCPPCRKEMPLLNKIAGKYKDQKDIVFIGITFDSTETVKKFLAKREFRYQVIAGADFLVYTGGITVFPTNIVIDRQGKIQYVSPGFSEETPAKIEEAIKKAVKKK